MTTKTAKGKIYPNFNHRLSITDGEPLDQRDLLQAIESATQRAEAVLTVLGDYLLSVDGEELVRPDFLYFTLDSVRCDLLDIRAISAAIVKGGA